MNLEENPLAALSDAVRHDLRSRVHITDSGCWVFPNVGPKSEPRITVNGERITASRVAFALHHKRIPKNCVYKTCKNTQCVNPEHMYEAANIDDPFFRERFWSKVNVLGDDDCWTWRGAIQSMGYGQLYIGNTAYRAHRVSFYLTHGIWPNVICHKCDNPPCVNPNHLENGTHKKNMEDRSARGRANIAYGEEASNSRLTNEIVMAIRAEYESGSMQKELAKKYGTSQPHISAIVNRKTWSHIL